MAAWESTISSFSPLSSDDLYRLHLASLDILERTGVLVQEGEARRLLIDAGAHADGEERVRIPPWLVKKALGTAPERIVLYSRSGSPAIALEAGRVCFGTGSDTPNTIDPRTHERRKARKQDVRDIARLCDALGNISFLMSMGIPSDVPTDLTFVHEFDAMVQSSAKPIVFTAYDNRDMRTILDMAVAVVGSRQRLRERPFLMLYSEPLAPLVHTRIGTEKLLFCAEHSIPCAYPSGIMAGGNAPVTLGGAIAQGNAEVLSGLVISQLKRPGAPFLYGGNVTVMDMRTSILTYGAPEFALSNSIFAALARYYRLPVWSLAGCSDSKVLDAQAGAEAAVGILAATLSGGNLVHDVGYLESGLTSCMEMIVLGDELIAMCRRYARGVELDDTALAADVIDAVGPGGAFIDSEHTRAHFRSAIWTPRVMDRRRWDAWRAAGSPGTFEHLNAEVQAILARHHPEPLPADQQRELARIIDGRSGAAK